MASIIRADTAQLRDVARQMRATATQINAGTSELARAMAALDTTWSGSARERGMARWGEIHPHYLPNAARLEHFARELDGLADRLEEAARVFGDGVGLLNISSFIKDMFGHGIWGGIGPHPMPFPPIPWHGKWPDQPGSLNSGFTPPFTPIAPLLPGSGEQAPGFLPSLLDRMKLTGTLEQVVNRKGHREVETEAEFKYELGAGSLWNTGTSHSAFIGAIGANLMSGSWGVGVKADKDYGVRAGLYGEGHLAGVEVSGKTGAASGSANVKVGGGEAFVGVGFNEKGLTAGISAEVYTIKAEAEGVIGDKNLGLTGGIEVGGPSAEASLGIKDNKLEAKIGGSLASIKGEAGTNIAGVNVGVGGEVGLKAELGGSIGPGGLEVKLPIFSIGFSFGGAK